MSDDLGQDIVAAGVAAAEERANRMLAGAKAATGDTAPAVDTAPDDGGATGQSFMGDKGRRAARGAMRTVSDVPKAAAIAGRAITTGAADRAEGAAAGYGAEVAGVLEVLADPDLSPEERAAYTKLGERLLGQQEFATALAQFHGARAETPLAEGPLYSAGEAIDKAVEGVVGAPDPARDADFTSMLAEGAGNMGGMMAAGMATGSTGPLAMGMSMGAVNQYEAAIRKGADEATALQAAGFGALVGSTDVLPLMYALNRFGPAVKGRVLSAIATHMAKSATAEAAQEGLQGVLDNLIAQELYDPEQRLLKDVGAQMLVGAILGAAGGAVGAARGMPPVDTGRGRGAPEAIDVPMPTETDMPAAPAAPADPGAAARADALVAEARTDPYGFANQDTVSEADLNIGDPNGPLVERAESPEALDAARRERAATGGAFEEAKAAIDRELARIDAEIRELGPSVLAVGGSGTFVDRLIGVESGGRADAKNPNSSATGLGQFLKSTWLRVVRKYEPALAAGRSEADLLAMRTDPAISRRMIEHLAKENAGHLRRNGFEATDGNLYLAHFAGPDGAVKLLKAGENATAESVLGKAVIDANPFLRGKTARWVVSWAAGKIGDPRAARARIGRLRARATRLGEALATAVENTTAEGAEMVRRATATLNAAADRVKLSDLEGIVRRITAVPDHANDMLTGMIDKLQRGETPGGKRPLARLIQSMGGVDPTSSAGVALKDAGITPRTHPGLFKSGGPIRDLSADIIGSEHPVLIANPELLDPSGRGDPNAIADALRDEAAGIARYLDSDQQAEQAALDDLSNALRDLGVDVDTASPAVVRQMLDEAQARAADSADRLAALDEAPSPAVDPRDVSPDLQEDVTGHLDAPASDANGRLIPDEVNAKADGWLDDNIRSRSPLAESEQAEIDRSYAENAEASPEVDALIEAGAVPLERPLVVYRGGDMPASGWASMSLARRTAENFGGENVRRIILPAGTRVYAPRSGISGGEVLVSASDAAAALASGDANSPAGRIYINHARIQSADDVRAMIQEMADSDADAIDAKRRGVVSNRQTIAESDAEFRNLEDLLGREPGPMSAAEAVAARKLLTSSGEQLVALAKKAAAPGATAADQAAFRRAAQVHYALQAEVIAARTETARALQAWAIPAGGDQMRARAIREMIEAEGGTDNIRRMAAHIATLEDSPAGLNHYLRESLGGRFRKAAYEMWVNGLLSGVKTHVVNVTSNAATMVWAIPERYVAAGVSRALYGGDVKAGEAAAMAYGLTEGVRDGLRMAFGMKSANEKLAATLGFSTKVDIGERQRAISPGAMGVDPASALGVGVDWMGRAIGLPTHLLGREDMFFKAVGYRMALRARAYRQASAEGLQGEAFAERVADIMADPPASISAEAVSFAEYQTFTNELGTMGQKGTAALNAIPGARLVVPFIRTPVNIMKYTLQRTPLALASRAIRADIAAGGERGALALARIGMGTTAMIGVMSLAADGIITGGGPEDRDLNKLWRDNGMEPYSVKIGGRWYSYSRADPIGMLVGIAADISEIATDAKEDDSGRLAVAGIVALKDNLLSKTYMSGVLDFLGAIDTRNPQASAERYVANFAGTLMPYSTFIRHVAQGQDPVVRDTKGMENAKGERLSGFLDELVRSVKAKIPGYSSELPPRRNLWGEIITRESGLGLGYDFVAPFTSRPANKKDAVNDEMLANRVAIEMPSRVIDGAPLTPEEYSEFVRIAGTMAKERLDKLVASDGFKRLPSGEGSMRSEVMRDVILKARAAARVQMLRVSPDLRERARQAKIEAERKLRGQ